MKKKRKKKSLKQIISSILIVIVILLTILLVYDFVNIKILKKGYTSIFGYTCFEVTSGSMRPIIEKNDIVIVKKQKGYKANDIVTFQYSDSFITHRIKQINKSGIITQGDANNNLDDAIKKEDIVGKKVLTIHKGALIKKVLLSPKVLLILIITLLIITITMSYKKFVRKNLKKPIKGLNPNVYLTKDNFAKKIDKRKFIEVAKFNILIITTVLLIGLIPTTLSRYDSTGVGTATTNIAFYLLNPTYMTNNIKVATLTPSTTPYVYTFSISNYTTNDTSEVDLEYVLQIITTTNLPLSYKLYMNEDYTSNSATNLVTNNNTTVQADANGTYFKHITLDSEYLYYNVPKINNYTLLIYYMPSSANVMYQNTIESIRIVIDSNQMVDS